MADVTIESLVPPIQLKFRPRIVFEVPKLPVPYAVAVLAFRAQPPSMHIIVLVTGVAVIGCLVLIQTPCVATLTGCCPMPTEKSVFGVSIVIESNHFPVEFVVTPLALCSKIGPMNIVFSVTLMAFGRCLVFVQRAGMAAVALRFAMVAFEMVRGISIVLKEQDLPVSFAVTAHAILAESALMLIVLPMAVVTIDGGLVSI